jgi:hypothetical protein
MRGAVGEALLIGDVVAHRVALDDVAVVDEDGVAGFGADRVDDRGGAGEAERVVGGIGVVVVGEHSHMDVGGLHDSQVRLTGSSLNGKWMKDHRCAGSGRAGEESAPRNAIAEVHRYLPGRCLAVERVSVGSHCVLPRRVRIASPENVTLA